MELSLSWVPDALWGPPPLVHRLPLVVCSRSCFTAHKDRDGGAFSPFGLMVSSAHDWVLRDFCESWEEGKKGSWGLWARAMAGGEGAGVLLRGPQNYSLSPALLALELDACRQERFPSAVPPPDLLC